MTRKIQFNITTALVLTLALVKWLIGGAHPHQYDEEKQRPHHLNDQPHLHKG